MPRRVTLVSRQRKDRSARAIRAEIGNGGPLFGLIPSVHRVGRDRFTALWHGGRGMGGRGTGAWHGGVAPGCVTGLWHRGRGTGVAGIDFTTR